MSASTIWNILETSNQIYLSSNKEKGMTLHWLWGNISATQYKSRVYNQKKGK